MARIITLTTDFGQVDPYVGVMKGVILGINPEAVIVDLTHEIRPQDIGEGAFALFTSFRYFPPSTIHLVVVDPGVGGERAALLAETDCGTFIGPDNGVLSWAITTTGQDQSGRRTATVKSLYELTNPKYWLPDVSATFHGRDVFAPVAAHLSLGVEPRQFGRPTSGYRQLPWPALERKDDGSLVGSVIHVDRFGNLITNVPAEELPANPADFVAHIAGQSITGLSSNYVGGGLRALVGSSGYLEIVLGGANAAAHLRAKPGTQIVVCAGGP